MRREVTLQMKFRKSKHLVPLTFTVILIAILGGQLVAETVLTADYATAGPEIVILKLMDDENVNWAVDDIVNRLESFVSDDIWIKNRIRVVETDDPSIVLDMDGDIIVYVSHGGHMSLVTGDHLTSWKEMAGIIESSSAKLHQFAVCFSSSIIQYGSEEASQAVYGVPGQRPAEFIDIDIASNVMLALGMNENTVMEARKRDILSMKQLLDWGIAPHILSFNYVTFDAYQDANAEYADVAQGVDYEYYWNLTTINSFSSVPDAIEDYVTFYWANSYDNYGYYHTRELYDPDFVYNKTWVDQYVWGVWNTSFVNGIYNGSIQIEQYGQVDISAGGPIQNDVEWMNLGRSGVGQFYVSLEKTDGVWEEGSVEKHQSDTGNVYGDSCTTPLLEYDPNWPVFYSSSCYEDSGTLVSEGNSYTVTSISSGTDWHGPSFVRPLPFAFRMEDFGCFKADLGLLDTTNPALLTSSVVALYDENEELALSLLVYDHWGGTIATQFTVAYHQPGSGPWSLSSPSTFYGGRNGTLQVFMDEDNGLRVDMPDRDPSLILWKNDIDLDRVIKYIAIQSYAWSTYSQNHEIIANISVSCVRSEYDVYFYDCQSTAGWTQEPSPTDFVESCIVANGTLHSTDGYLYADSIPSGTSTHGPLFVRELPQEVPVAGIRLLESEIEMTYLYGNLGHLFVCLFDDDKDLVVRFCAWDSQLGSSSMRYLRYYNWGAEPLPWNEWLESTPSGSWKATFKFWYDSATGNVMGGVDDGTPLTTTFYLDGSFDPSISIKYIGIQFARANSYPYHDNLLKLHSIKLEVQPRCSVWYDSCDSTSGWIRQSASSGFESPRQIHDSGTLYSGSGYLYADGIASGASWKWGPLFVKEIPGFAKVRDIYSLTAQIQFTDVSSRMGDLCVALFDENKELVVSLIAYDSWYGTSNRRYLVYYKSDAEGGGSNQWFEQQLYTSWTAKLQFYCDSTTKAAMSAVDDGSPQTHTHYTSENYDEDRIVRYIGIQFARSQAYTYNGVYLKLWNLRLLYNRHCKEFIDPCDSTQGWIQDLEWPNTIFDTASGSLTSTSGYLQVSGLSELNKGPFWYKELAKPFSVNQFTELAVQLQGAGPTNSRVAFVLSLYDEDKLMAARFAFMDPFQGDPGELSIQWYHERYCISASAWLVLTQDTWDITLRLYRTTDNSFIAEIPGTSPKTILDSDDWAMESSRVIRYIGIQWAYQGTPINNVRLKDVMLRSGYAYSCIDEGFVSSSITDVPPPDPSIPSPPPPEEPDFWWILLGGFWPEFHAKLLLIQDSTGLIVEGAIDLLFNYKIVEFILQSTETVTQTQAEQELTELEIVSALILRDVNLQMTFLKGYNAFLSAFSILAPVNPPAYAVACYVLGISYFCYLLFLAGVVHTYMPAEEFSEFQAVYMFYKFALNPLAWVLVGDSAIASIYMISRVTGIYETTTSKLNTAFWIKLITDFVIFALVLAVAQIIYAWY
jgi:hypothetical protein